MDLSTAWTLSAISVTTATALLELQTPAPGTIVSDPVEDLTILRIVGSFTTIVTVAALDTWSLALTVQDTTWTPATLLSNDADKRLLWSQTYQVPSVVPAGFASISWHPPGLLAIDATTDTVVPTGDNGDSWKVDISPDVKLRPGQALYLVGYESIDGGAMTTSSLNMRVLFQRSGRR